MWKGSLRSIRSPARPKTFLPWIELLSHRWEAVEITFDHENGYIIVEVIAAKIRCAVIDIGHEVFSGQRRTAAHDGGKALHAEFFAKLVLCLSDPVGIENHHIAGTKVCRGQFTNLFWGQSDGRARRVQARYGAIL